MKKSIPVDIRLFLVLSGLLFGSGASLIGQSQARWLSIELSGEAGLLWHPAFLFSMALGWTLTGFVRKPKRSFFWWPSVIAIAAAGSPYLGQDIINRWVEPLGIGWPTVFIPLFILSGFGVVFGIAGGALVRPGKAQLVPWFMGASFGYGVGCLIGSLVIVGSGPGLESAHYLGMALMALCGLLGSWSRLGEAYSTPLDPTESTTDPGHWLVTIAAGLAVASMWRTLGIPFQSGLLGRTLTESMIPLGFSLGCAGLMVRKRFTKTAPNSGAVAGFMLVGVFVSYDLSRRGSDPLLFESLLGALDFGTTSESYLLGCVLPSFGLILIGCALSTMWLLSGRRRAGLSSVVCAASFALGFSLEVLGIASAIHLAFLAAVLVAIPALMTVFSLRAEIRGLTRLATGAFLVLGSAMAMVVASSEVQEHTLLDVSTRHGVLGDVVVSEELGHVFVDGKNLPDVAGAPFRSVLSSLVHRLHTDKGDRALVLETVKSGAGPQLSELGHSSVGVLELLDTDGVALRSARMRLNPIIDGSLDLIIQEPIDPRRPESAGVLTVEHFKLLSEKIAESGSVMVWISLSRFRWENFGLVARSFSRAFDSTTIWLGDPLANEPVVGLFGRKQLDNFELDWSRIKTYFADHPRRSVLEKFSVEEPLETLRHYVGDELFIGEAFLGNDDNRDMNPRVESASIRRFEPDANVGLDNLPRLLTRKENLVGRLRVESLEPKTRGDLEHRLRVDSACLVKAAQARSVLLRAARARMAPESVPDSFQSLERLAIQFLSDGWAHSIEDRYVTAVVLEVLNSFIAQRRFDEAEDLARASSLRAPQNAAIRNLRGLALMALERDEEAKEAFQGALEIEPEDPEINSNLAFAHLLLGEKVESLKRLKNAERLAGRLPPLGDIVLQLLEGVTQAEDVRPYLEFDHPLFGRRLARLFLSGA